MTSEISSLPERLDPVELDAATQHAVRALMLEGSSPNTAAAYEAAIRYWAAWYALRYGIRFAVPLPTAVVMQFLVDHALRTEDGELTCDLPSSIDEQLVRLKVKARPGPLSLNTVQHRLAVLSKAHQLQGGENPCRAEAVQELLARIRRAYARRQETPARKEAITRDILEKLLDTCDDSLRGCRDRALLLFAWASGGRRRSEVVAATVENTIRVSENAYLYRLVQTKTNQEGKLQADSAKPLTAHAAQALAQWLDMSGIRQGAIFRRIRRGERIGEPLDAAAVRDIVRRRCRMAGIVGDFSAHSLRSGFVTEAARQNVSLGDTMAMTGHKSIATVMTYFRAGAALDSPAADLFGEGKKTDTRSKDH